MISKSSRFAMLQDIKCVIAGKNLYMRFTCSTGDAMGMNMVSKGVQNVLDFLQSDFPDMDVMGISENEPVVSYPSPPCKSYNPFDSDEDLLDCPTSKALNRPMKDKSGYDLEAFTTAVTKRMLINLSRTYAVLKLLARHQVVTWRLCSSSRLDFPNDNPVKPT